MPGRLRVDGTFTLGSRALFVAHGVILDGALAVGEHVTVPAGIDAPVAHVEHVLHSASEGHERPALCFLYRDEAELARWRSLVPPGTVLVTGAASRWEL